MQGTITFYNDARGFGFIQMPNGQSIFFHVSNWTDKSRPVLAALVEFQVAPPLAVGKKPQAVAVKYANADAFEVLANSEVK